jgi:TolB protein
VRGALRWCVAALLALPGTLAAQDTLASPSAGNGVRVGITYTPGTRPSLAVLPGLGAGAVLDSVTAILRQDLDYSDRFEILAPGAAAPAESAGVLSYRVLAALGTDFAVTVAPDGAAQLQILMHDVRIGAVKDRVTLTLPAAGGEAMRHAVHRASDEVVRWATGTPGIASTSIMFGQGGGLWRVDPDGEGRTRVPSAGNPALSAAWSPDGRMIAYTAVMAQSQPIMLQDLATGRRDVVPTTGTGMNITPEFSRDGRRLAFAHGTEDGTDIYVYDVARACCVTRLTLGRYYDNLSPTWSPDGHRIAFISTRAGLAQLYVMSADGSGQEVLAPFDYGSTGQTNAPAWSPDGQTVAFHREVNGVRQIFVLDLATRTVRQITGEGRNEDPTWAPDGRHLGFVSSRTGVRQLWIVDLETGRMRAVGWTAGARLPAWSPRD